MDIHLVISILRRLNPTLNTPAVGVVHERWRDPFRTLISCILSLRTQDNTTRAASMRLFDLADTPEKMVAQSEETIRDAIYPVGFYRRKAANILEVSRDLIDRFEGRVPDDLDALLSLNGVGRKTANLVLTVTYNKPGICVDTHVQHITNRWGYVKTKTPEQTEMALRKKLPKEYWIEFNDLLVPFGQNICMPISPFCSTCPLYEHCLRVGVKRSR